MKWLRWFRRVAGWCFGIIALTWHILVPGLVGVVVVVLLWQGLVACGDGLRIFGLLLQVVGFGLVAWGLIDVVRRFGEHSPWGRLRGHLKRFPKPPGRGRTISASANIVVGPATVRAEGFAPRVFTDFTQRVAALEQDLGKLRRELGEARELIRRNKNEANEAIATISERLDKLEQRLRGLLGETLAGGVQREWAGLFCFALGVILSTATPEICGLPDGASSS